MARAGTMLLAAILLAIAAGGCSATAPPPAPTSPPEPTSTAVMQRQVMELKIEGRILFGREGSIWLWDNGNLKRLTDGGADRQPQWSPDGSTVVYVEESDGFSNLLVLQPGVTKSARLTNFRATSGRGGTWVYRPVWSPDGTRIAYLSEQTSWDMNLWVMNADGRGARQLTTFDNYAGGLDSPTWSPDGTQMAFSSFRTGVEQIWLYTLATARWQQVTTFEGGAYDPAWSPDGKHIAFTARADRQNDIWVMSPDGSNKSQVTIEGTCRAPVWSPDSQYLAYIAKKGTSFDIFAVKLSATGSSQLAASETRQLTKGQQVDPVSGLSWTK